MKRKPEHDDEAWQKMLEERKRLAEKRMAEHDDKENGDG